MSAANGKKLEELLDRLERTIADMPGPLAGLPELLMLVSEGLERVKAGDGDADRLRDSVAATLSAVKQCLTMDDPAGRELVVDEAARSLLAALEREPEEWDAIKAMMAATEEDAPDPAGDGDEMEESTAQSRDPKDEAGTGPEASSASARSAAPSGAAFDYSLDDAAAFLIQLEPSDTDGWMRLGSMLRTLASGIPEVSPVHGLLLDAASDIDRVVEGEADAEATLGELGQSIDTAMRILEMGGELEMGGGAGPSAESAPAESAGETGDDQLPPDSDPSLLTSFVVESFEHLDAAEAGLLTLEENPDDEEAISTVFRAFHTIKGTGSALGLNRIADLAHKAENLLSRIRDGEMRCTGARADVALQSVDFLKVLVAGVEDALAGAPLTVPEGYDDLVQALTRLEAGEELDASTAKPTTAPLGDVAETTPGGRARHSSKGGRRRASGAESWVRVRTNRLDKLIDMVGELVIAQSMVAQDAAHVQDDDSNLARDVSHAGKIVRELQDLTVSLRMVPLTAMFQRMSRLVRDLTRKTGKEIEFITEGEDTEIDRNMVDVLADPLLHLVRNAVDHGIEPPDERERAGKPRAGTIQLSAYHAGGKVVVELRDDGRGLNRDAIVEKALSKGLIESDKGLTDKDVFNLIFAPGFSTAKEVTDVSGRGVGMDVVKRNVEELRGRVDVTSEPGKGTTFALGLPLTLALTDGMMIRIGRERYIVPTVHIDMSFRPERKLLSTVAGRGELVMLRGELLPIVRLHRLFEIPHAATDPTEALLVVVGDGEQRCALLVDELLGQHQVVMKSLGGGMNNVPGISGATILGDGSVGLMLDPAELVALARSAPGPDRDEVESAA